MRGRMPPGDSHRARSVTVTGGRVPSLCRVSVVAAIRATGLGKSYGSGVIALEGIDLDVAQGERIGFLGPNGAGKTTFIRCALGVLRPTEGTVEILGHDITHDRLAALGEVGYVPGDLGMIRQVSGARMLDALARLHPRPPVLRDQLLSALELSDSDLRRRIREYSTGMRQKLGLVAALQHDPPVIMLDEPTAGLDPVMQARLLGVLDDRARAGRTVFFSSHVLGEVDELCDRVAMVRGGKLLLVRDVDELRRARVRTVEVLFDTAVDPATYAVDGMGEVRVEGHVHHFTMAGDPGPLLAGLAPLSPRDITIEAARLEEVFRALYLGDGD
ncbi:MAG: ABC transporter ATP-binding protein [Actinobacteria bacterium]|nr:ABC transporter ATP-binding protein [Actinomycetota bacterium]